MKVYYKDSDESFRGRYCGHTELCAKLSALHGGAWVEFCRGSRRRWQVNLDALAPHTVARLADRDRYVRDWVYRPKVTWSDSSAREVEVVIYRRVDGGPWEKTDSVEQPLVDPEGESHE